MTGYKLRIARVCATRRIGHDVVRRVIARRLIRRLGRRPSSIWRPSSLDSWPCTRSTSSRARAESSTIDWAWIRRLRFEVKERRTSLFLLGGLRSGIICSRGDECTHIDTYMYTLALRQRHVRTHTKAREVQVALLEDCASSTQKDKDCYCQICLKG
eukprot:1571580-Pleurochrysis_carterae.AAC.2